MPLGDAYLHGRPILSTGLVDEKRLYTSATLLLFGPGGGSLSRKFLKELRGSAWPHSLRCGVHTDGGLGNVHQSDVIQLGTR